MITGNDINFVIINTDIYKNVLATKIDYKPFAYIDSLLWDFFCASSIVKRQLTESFFCYKYSV